MKTQPCFNLVVLSAMDMCGSARAESPRQDLSNVLACGTHAGGRKHLTGVPLHAHNAHKYLTRQAPALPGALQ